MFTRAIKAATVAVVSVALAFGSVVTTATPAEAASKKITKVSKPKISGTKAVGKTLTGKPDTKVKPSGTQRTYQWLRSGKAIPGATSTKYTLVGADRGKKVSFRTCYTKSKYKKKCVTSKSYTIGYGTLSVATPKITSTGGRVGDVVTVSHTKVTGVSVKVAWFAAGKQVADGSSTSYTLQPSDVGKGFQAKVTYSGGGYKGKTANSNAFIVMPGWFTPNVDVARVKTANPGTAVSAKITGLPAGSTINYQWHRCSSLASLCAGAGIPGATNATYTLTEADLGSVIWVGYTITKTGWGTHVGSKIAVEKVTDTPVTPDPTPTPTEPSQPPAGPPTVDSVSPVSGALAGGDTMTITGTNLQGATVTFRGDTTSARPTITAKVSSSTATSITLTVPAGLGGKSVVTVTTAAGSATGSYTYVTADRQLGSFEQQVINEVNARRTSPGGQVCGTTTYPAVAALPVDPKLNDLAQSHANDLGYRWVTDYNSSLSHVTAGTTGSNIRYQAAGFKKNPVMENTAIVAASGAPQALVDGWMGSPSHCSTIMMPEAIGIGVGTWTGTLDGWSTPRRLAALDLEWVW